MKSVAQQIREMGDRLSALYNEGPADDMMNVDQGMEPEDAQDAAAEFFKVDPAEFDKFFSSRNESSELDRIKKLSGI